MDSIRAFLRLWPGAWGRNLPCNYAAISLLFAAFQIKGMGLLRPQNAVPQVLMGRESE
jgi:hypothetical protein